MKEMEEITLSDKNEIKPQSLIITCEICKQVKRFDAKNEDEAEKIFRNFKCANNCDRSFLSYITIRQLQFKRPTTKMNEKSRTV